MDPSALPLFTSLPPPLVAFVCLSCDYLLEQMQLGSFLGNFALSPFLQNTSPFLSGREQSAGPLIPENLPESFQPLSSQGCCGLPLLCCCLSGHVSFPVCCASWQAGPAALSTLSFACFLYSLTCSGGSLSFINVLYAAPGTLVELLQGRFPSSLLTAEFWGCRDRFVSQKLGVICHQASN